MRIIILSELFITLHNFTLTASADKLNSNRKKKTLSLGHEVGRVAPKVCFYFRFPFCIHEVSIAITQGVVSYGSTQLGIKWTFTFMELQLNPDSNSFIADNYSITLCKNAQSKHLRRFCNVFVTLRFRNSSINVYQR